MPGHNFVVIPRITLLTTGIQQTRRHLKNAWFDEERCKLGIERIEAARGHQPHGAAFGRLGIDPVEVGKAGGILEITELGIAMAAGQLGMSHLAQQQTDQQVEEVSHQAAVRSMAKHFFFVGTVTACIDRKKADSSGAGAIILTTVMTYFVKDSGLGRAHLRFGRLG